MKTIISIFFGLLLISFNVDGQVINLNGNWKFHIGDQHEWSKSEFNDQSWEVIKVPSPWEDQGFNGYDGFAWYRINFDGQRLSKAENYYVNLGFIDDSDEVYLNGRLIGFSGSMPPRFKTAFNSERKYKIPYDIIDFRGENTIAIRVFDVTLGGGITDGNLGIFQSNKSRMLVDLEGLWEFSLSRNGQPVKDPHAFKNIMVPNAWEYQGYYKYDGFAWYRHSFTLPDTFTAYERDLVLVMGKIDDFDKTYLNGKLIGETNDHRPFALSSSYNKLRVYPIPQGLLKRGFNNYIEVLVEDMGNIGGIYEGPVGITTKEIYERYYR